MPLSLKTKQVALVTLFVGLAVVLLSAWYVSSLATVWLGETQKRAELLAEAIYQFAFSAVQAEPNDPVAGLARDEGLRSILEASLFSEDVLYVAIVDVSGRVIVEEPEVIGRPLTPADDLTALLEAGPIEQARAIFTPELRSFEYRRPLLLGDTAFGSIRVGVSTVFLKEQIYAEMRTPVITAAVAIVLASLMAMLLAQLTLRPIHVIRSGLARLGRGELDVSVDLPEDAELAELGDSFKAVTARLAADRLALAGQRATLESVVETFEDAVGLFDANGCLLFANPAMRAALGDRNGAIDTLLPAAHPYRLAVLSALERRQSLDPATVQVPDAGQRLLLTHVVEDADGSLIGVMIVARNVEYLSEVETTLSYSRKLAALSRLSAGIAHEVKNPLNATMIHLELLRIQLANKPDALEHVSVIAAQVRRLDEVVQGFLKFTRPEDLELRPVAVLPAIEELMPIITAEASKSGVEVRLEVPPSLPPVHGDAGMLQQAFLNLALNACQAMPHGGRLRIAAAPAAPPYIEVLFEDTGVGIEPANLSRIFDLYFTTKESGSGIGLSLVYRTVQLHDGEIEVQSVPGRGTTFRLLLRQVLPPPVIRPVAGPLGLRELATEGSTAGRTTS
jgi:signal transduction histidine kinase